jgi:hypothetical protein
LTRKTFHSWVKSLSWLVLSGVAVIGYLSQREWFIHATNLWVVGVFEGACALIGFFVFLDKYGDSLSEVYFGLRELGKLKKNNS